MFGLSAERYLARFHEYEKATTAFACISSASINA
jgi:hypothetical protein